MIIESYEAFAALDAQGVFNHVVNHLREQGRPALDPLINSCRYRYQPPDGPTLACAAGCLIPDKDYDPATMEGQRFGFLMIHHTPGKGDWPEVLPACYYPHIELINRLQRVHDAGPWDTVAVIEPALQAAAKEFGLRYTPLEDKS